MLDLPKSSFAVLQPKCEMYWPMDETSPISFRDISVSMSSYVKWADFVIRELVISKVCITGLSKLVLANSFVVALQS